MYEDVIFRWSVGLQNTISLSSNNDRENEEIVYLCKLSILSFQKWFHESKFVVFYNGSNFDDFCIFFNRIGPELRKQVEIINQFDLLEKCNGYHFYPFGVFWKWIPFRYDINYYEVSIDTDIICISKPTEWMKWIEKGHPILVAPERFEKVNTSTCGNLASNPIIRNKTPFNCGIVGQKKYCDYSKEFFECSKNIKYGDSKNSIFIDEQGCINLWVYTMELNNIKHSVLDYNKCSWLRDFLYYILHGVNVETVHATSWHKKILIKMGKIFEEHILLDYDLNNLFQEVVSFCDNMDEKSKKVIIDQLKITK